MKTYVTEPISCASRKRGEEHKIETRKDDVANCVTSIDTDSMVAEGVEYKGQFLKEGDAVDTSRSETFGTHVMDGVSPTLRSERPDANAVCVAAKELKEIAQSGRSCEVGVTINPDGSLRPYNSATRAKDGISEFVTQHEENAANTVTTSHGGNVYGRSTRYRIRKLTEREVFRLMDVSEGDIDKIQGAGISKTAQYKLAGNSIVVSCLYHIFRKMFIERGCEERQMSLF